MAIIGYCDGNGGIGFGMVGGENSFLPGGWYGTPVAEALPVDLRDRAIYYVGPVDAVAGEAVGPAGPTTATRMDRFVDELLEKTGLLVMIGKAERGPEAIEAIRRHKAASLIAVGGAAYLVSKAIKSAKVLAFADLGMEAIHEFVVEDMPVTVAVSANGVSVHATGPEEWRRRIAQRQASAPAAAGPGRDAARRRQARAGGCRCGDRLRGVQSAGATPRTGRSAAGQVEGAVERGRAVRDVVGAHEHVVPGSAAGAVIGGQAGYNYQIGAAVLGIWVGGGFSR